MGIQVYCCTVMGFLKSNGVRYVPHPFPPNDNEPGTGDGGFYWMVRALEIGNNGKDLR